MAMDETCRLCNEISKLKRGFDFGRFYLTECCRCGFQQISPEPTSAELNDLYGAVYFQKAKYTDTKAIELEYKRRQNFMAQAGFKPGDTLLEIGCGAGQFISTCVDSYNWYGIDFSADGISAARKRLSSLPEERLTAGAIESFAPEIPIGGFDGVLIFDTIEHVYDPAQMLKRASSWMKPDGRMIVTTPNIGATVAKLMGRRWPFMTPPEHLSFFNQSCMSEAMRNAGLKITYSKSLGKFANIAFIIYKAGRVGLLPKFCGKVSAKLGLGKVTIYVPTGDVMYVIAEKRGIF